MRITMNMITKQYRSSLNSSLGQLNSASNKATTYRAFDKTSEDPFSASKAYRLRRESSENDTYQSILGDAADQLDTAQSAMMSVYNIVSTSNTGDTLQAITGTMSQENRQTIANKLRQMQDAMIAPANTKFGDKYLFGGSEMTDPPFVAEVDSTGKKHLYYRGIDVDTGKLKDGPAANLNGALLQFGANAPASINGKKIEVDFSAATTDPVTVDDTTDPTAIKITVPLTTGATNKDLLKTLQTASGVTGTSGTAYDFSKVTMTGDMNVPITSGMTSTTATDTVDMSKLAKEQSLVDLGMGLKVNTDGSINAQSAFDAAIPGIAFMGYGTSTIDGVNGISNNVYSLLGQIADQLDSSSFTIDKIQPYLTNLGNQQQNLMAEITKSGTKSNFLDTTKTNLESMGQAIIDKDDKVEFLNPADAIMDYYMQQYSYNAALQMGTKIISKTFLDYME